MELTTASGTARQTPMPSKLPAGTEHAYMVRAGVQSIELTSKFETIVIMVTGKSFRTGDTHGASPIPSDVTPLFTEGISRKCLAGLGTRRLSTNGAVSISGRSYSAMKASGTNTRYIDLAAWASANSLTVSTGQDGTVKSFTKGGTLWIVPLASNKIKKGSVWQTLPDIVMQKDGKFMIPISALSN